MHHLDQRPDGDRQDVHCADTTADEVAWCTEINADANVSLGFNWGSTASNRGTIRAPKVQRVAPQGEDYKGDLLLATELRLQPSAGNGDFVPVTR